MTTKQTTLKFIGYIQTDFGEGGLRRHPEKVVSNLLINRILTAALDGIESYSHLVVITGIKELKIYPRRKDIKKVGLFATRTPNRPNPIGVTVLELLDRYDN